MISLSDFLRQIVNEEDILDVIEFLLNNKWFGSQPENHDGEIMITEYQAQLYRPAILRFINTDNSLYTALQLLAERLPETAKLLNDFASKIKIDESSVITIAGFIATYAETEIRQSNNSQIEDLVNRICGEVSKKDGDTFTFFLSWLRSAYRAKYNKDFVLEKRYMLETQNEAYSFDEYIELAYKLFNDEYILDNDMFVKAAESINYTDTWLYLSMHFISSLRTTDLERIYHPVLPYSPEEVIEKIKNDEFTHKDCLEVINSITEKMCWLPFTPNKTSAYSNIESVKLDIPASCEQHFGRLFALAEAHRLINGTGNTPIIRRVSTYEQISRYMGDDIGELFLTRNFGSRSATKSYLQTICMVGDAETNNGDVMGSKGYILAALARSHKGSYGEFATTTFEYLKDAKMNGFSPEYVIFELLERGVLSFITAEMLEVATDGQFSKLSVKAQTEVIKNTHLIPNEVEAVVAATTLAKEKASSCLAEALNSDEDIITILHKIASGQAFSKQAGTMCLLSAVKKVCPFNERRQCIGCDYEILTKTTLFHIASEYKRMRKLHKTVIESEKNKYATIAKGVLIPKLAEALECLRSMYGEETYEQYGHYIEELIYG